ncbi:hypothetical protein BS17DRAFT_793086 [Gyrodon lividus]|nr:hypothetical protein BS17DRAFT_793086 [Gyrodon lividus]
MLAVIHAQAPELLTKFKCSEVSTRTAAKLPANAEEKCEESFFRLVYIIKWHHVPPKLIISFNQIGCNILPSSSTRQVDIIAKDENTPEGTFLPFQQVWGGASEQSLLLEKAHGMSDVQDYGFNFAFAKRSDRRGSYFSTLKTMKEWVAHIFEPYRRCIIETDPVLFLRHRFVKCLWCFNCYPVHTGKVFRSYVFKEYPYVILCFVPAGCKPKY